MKSKIYLFFSTVFLFFLNFSFVYADDLEVILNMLEQNNTPNYQYNNFHNQNYAYPKSYIVYDFNNGEILESKNIDISLPIASITKLMTANVFLKLNNNSKCYNSITSEDRDYIKNTSTRLPINTPIDCHSLLQAMLVSSDNYAASSLSRAINGISKHEFVKQMNSQAKEWGMNNTYFFDPAGLSPKNVSSVWDLLILAHHSMNNNLIKDLSNITSFKIENNNFQKVVFRNTNKLIREKQFSALVSKTGYIRESGYNLLFVNSSYCNGRLIGVISLNNSSSLNRANFTSNKLIEYGCNNNLRYAGLSNY